MADASPDLAVRAKPSKANKPPKLDKPPKVDKMAKKPKEKQGGNVDTKGLAVTRAEDIGLWFTEMITKAGMVSYYDVQDM
jgi:prolyl-tRNA synthetase